MAPNATDPQEQGAATPLDRDLADLERRLAQDLTCLCLPPVNWVPARTHDGQEVADVVIIGGGMCGLVEWLGLQASGVRNVRILDRAEACREGPWETYARMETLRSPKQLTGPAFGIGALTFQAWFRAQSGDGAWAELGKIPRPMWMQYLRWYRKALEIPIENGVRVDRVTPDGDLLRLGVSGAGTPDILTRKLVCATGRDGTGRPAILDFVGDLDRRFWAHSSDDIDFAALRGKRVAVIGVGASAIDNAAEALEAGAAEVRHLISRPEMPTINKMMGIGSAGFVNGFRTLPDEWRWRFMQYSLATQTPPPRGSTLRVSRHANAHFHFGKAVQSLWAEADAVRIGFADATGHEADFVILGTGFVTDPMARTEFGDTAADILLWRDVDTPPPEERNDDLSRFPYLAEDFTFRERVPGAAPWLSSVYCFNFGATASMGKVSGDIPGVSEGARWLAQYVAASLYREDVAVHFDHMLAYGNPELLGDEWRPSPLPTLTPRKKIA